MATYMGTGIVDSQTVTFKAAAAVDDVRGRAIALDANGKAVLASDPSKPIIGIAVLCAGADNTLDGKDGAINIGDDVDIQVKDMGYGVAGAAITAGTELTTNASGMLVPAAAGNFIVATALNTVVKSGRVFLQITKYMKGAASA